MATSETDLKADPAIVEIWVEGWTLTRQVSPAVFENGAYRIEVGAANQTRRFVFPEYSDWVRHYAEAITEPMVFLKVCAPPESVKPALTACWQIQSPGYMMLLTGSMRIKDAGLPKGYAYQYQTYDRLTLINILDERGEVAATGKIAFPGEMAIYDRIRTHEDHRRKGLGRSLLRQLELIAQARNIQNSVLVATPDGRALYEPLGWQLHSLYTTAVISSLITAP